MFRNLLSSAGLGKLLGETSHAATIAKLDGATLRALDKELIAATDATSKGVLGQTLGAYGKVRKPFSTPYNLLYGSGGKKGWDNPALAASLAGGFGLVNYGGKLARPGLEMFSSMATKIDPAMAGAYKTLGAGSPIAMLKPATAIAAKPLMALGMTNPVYAALALPFAGAAAYKGGRGLLRRMGQARRLNQLRRGIAPSLYKNQALQLGLK